MMRRFVHANMRQWAPNKNREAKSISGEDLMYKDGPILVGTLG